MPKISIIVAVYNLEEYLPTCIDSILDQTFKDFELILINDGSTDRSLEICENYAGLDNRIKVINQTNQGLAQVRNIGINAAQGEYIGFVDGDDWIEAEMYECLYSLCKKHNAQISTCLFNRVNNNNEKQNIAKKEMKEIEILNSEEAIKKTFERKLSTFNVWNKLFAREILSNITFPKGREYEDAAVLHYAYHLADKIVFVKSPLYNFLIRDTGITQTILKPVTEKRFDKVLNYQETYDFMKKYYPHLCDIVTVDFINSINKIIWDIINERSTMKKFKYLIKISKNMRKISIRILKNDILSFKQKILAQLLAWVPILGVLYYKIRY